MTLHINYFSLSLLTRVLKKTQTSSKVMGNKSSHLSQISFLQLLKSCFTAWKWRSNPGLLFLHREFLHGSSHLCSMYEQRQDFLFKVVPGYLGEGKSPNLHCISSSVISSMLFPDAHSLLLQEISLQSPFLPCPVSVSDMLGRLSLEMSCSKLTDTSGCLLWQVHNHLNLKQLCFFRYRDALSYLM